MIYGRHRVVLMWVSVGPSGPSLSNEKWSFNGLGKKCLPSDGYSVVEISVSEKIVFSNDGSTRVLLSLAKCEFHNRFINGLGKNTRAEFA